VARLVRRQFVSYFGNFGREELLVDLNIAGVQALKGSVEVGRDGMVYMYIRVSEQQ
jgi:hypothetical protein